MRCEVSGADATAHPHPPRIARPRLSADPCALAGRSSGGWGGASGPGGRGCRGRHDQGRRPTAGSCDRLAGCGGGIIPTAMNGVLVAVGIAQMLVAAVQIRRVLRVWRASSQRPELRGRVVLVVAVWAGFGLLGLVWLAQGL